jgi:hypothetical protein
MAIRSGNGFWEWLGEKVVLRSCIGCAIAGGLAKGAFAVFSQLGETEDWVLEWRNWITVGVYVVAFGIWVGFVLVTRPNPTEKDER